MTEAGILPEDERLELIGGEVVPMSPKGVIHENVKKALARFWCKAVPDTPGSARGRKLLRRSLRPRPGCSAHAISHAGTCGALERVGS
jgi:hypothetical protein